MLSSAGDDAPGGSRANRPPPAGPGLPPAPAVDPAGRGLEIGLTESRPTLLWSRAAVRSLGDSGLDAARARLDALRPRHFRLLVDWSAVQPDPRRPPDWTARSDGCERGVPPCRPYAGLRDVLRAVASRQAAGERFDVLVSIYGVPDWAAAPPHGCERSDAAARSRPITPAGLRGYRALIRSLADLAAAQRVTLRWWSPWNEPNGSFFVSPQRRACDAAAPLLSAGVYTRLARAMRAELQALPGDPRLVMAELAGVPGPRSTAAGIGEFYAALPDDVLCSASVYAQHAYAQRGDPAAARRPVEQLERALDRRPCAADKPIWITETGAGGPHAGAGRTGGAAGLRADCRALDAALRGWARDPRVQAAFQYTFRDDPSFPVGLADARLGRTWPTYDAWLAWGGDRAPADPAPELPPACAPR